MGGGPISGGTFSIVTEPSVELFFLTALLLDCSVMAIAYDSRLLTALEPAGGFLTFAAEAFAGALEEVLVPTFGIPFKEVEAADVFLAGVVFSAFLSGGVVTDFDLVALVVDKEVRFGLAALRTFLSVLVFLGAPSVAEDLDAVVLLIVEAVLVPVPEAGLPPVTDILDVAVVLLLEEEAVLVLELEAGLPTEDVFLDVAAVLEADEAVLVPVAEVGLLVDPLEALDAAELGR